MAWYCSIRERNWCDRQSAGSADQPAQAVGNGLIDRLASDIEPGAEGLGFLPYLVGERSPIKDPKARGGFFGITLRHNSGHFVRGVLERVAFALRQIVDTMVECGADLTTLPNEEHARRYEAYYSAFLEPHPRLKGERVS
jgi:xylulokinase